MAQQIIINVEGNNILPSLRKVLSLMKGISIVEKRETKDTNTSRNTSAYRQSLNDIENGRMNTYKSAEEFFEKIGI